jgi:hypothetical protein
VVTLNGVDQVSQHTLAFNGGSGSLMQYILFKNFRVTQGMQIGQAGQEQTTRYIKFDGIDFRNTVNFGQSVINLSSCGFGTIHCEKTGGAWTVHDITDHIWITGGKIHDTAPVTGDTWVYGIYQNGASDSVFEYIEFYNTSGSAVQQEFGYNNNNIWRYNYFHDFAQATLTYTQFGARPAGYGYPGFALITTGDPTDFANTGRNNQIYENLIIQGSGGLNPSGGGGSAIYNNTLYKIANGRWPCDAAGNACYAAIQQGPTAGSPANVIKNNIIYDARIPTISSDTPTAYVQSNNIMGGTNPLFINAANETWTAGDAPGFYLQPGSPAINFGTPTISASISISPCPATPLCFNNGFPDAGAYETGTAVGPVVGVVIK